MCDEFARNDSRVKVIHKDNGGAGVARNVGLDIASGELIGIVDSDDYIAPDMYTKLYGLMSGNDVDMCICGYVQDYGSGNLDGDAQVSGETEIITGDEALHRLVTPGLFSIKYVYLWNKLYKADLF
ncbi:MAG: glycosyltransferase [Synergistaceae bacterium]|nr:glycosyltransferase [Synergistaceae bacterium]